MIFLKKKLLISDLWELLRHPFYYCYYYYIFIFFIIIIIGDPQAQRMTTKSDSVTSEGEDKMDDKAGIVVVKTPASLPITS